MKPQFIHLNLNFLKHVNDENRLGMRFYNKKVMSQSEFQKNEKSIEYDSVKWLNVKWLQVVQC